MNRSTVRFGLAVLAVISADCGLRAQNAVPDLRDAMPADLFAEAGLEKLSSEELDVLAAWIESYRNGAVERVPSSAGEASSAVVAAATDAHAGSEPIEHIQVPVGENAFGAEDVREEVEKVFQRAAPEELVATIPGNFRGWSGKTVFRLSNGQVWKQASSGRFVVNLDDPTVTIERGTFGAYYLSVEGYGSRVRVKRLR